MTDWSEDDRRHMRRALAMAKAQRGRTGDNPAVGCTIISSLGHRLADGATADGGRPHAEELALESLGGRAPGATVYVTLEPCRERSTGTASCSARLVQSGAKRVVCAISDPHPLGSGGLEALRAAGIQVDIGLMEEDAAALYADFFKGPND
ncbi:MAG: bifunctional diaminohydroxyphosphoribosylaminopyrimidine deaminase/5-amino-6-(5-phosphoribosylamino)uracil reductase RibD [Pseudomonadota bacterium]